MMRWWIWCSAAEPSEGSLALHQIHQRIIADQAFALNVPVETR